MFRIAICDDEPLICSQIENIILNYAGENNLEIEFGKLHFIKKGKTTEELEKFTNPKRDYLKNLLEMDSQHSRKSSEIQDR